MDHREGTFRVSGGLDLYYQSWLPGGPPRALLTIIHGQGDHSGRFAHLVEPLVTGGIGVYGFDLRGFGRSPGRKGHINRWKDYLEDVQAFLRLVRDQQPGKPVFMMGYSLGSVISLDYILTWPGDLTGAILSSLPVKLGSPASLGRVLLARMLSRLWPTFSLNVDGDFNEVTRDEAVQEALRQDPLHHGWVTSRWGSEFLAARERIAQSAARIQLPVLFLHGSDDSIALASGVEYFFEQVTFPDKTLNIYPGSRHEPHNDLDHARVAADVVAWIDSHLLEKERPA